jgi:osmotically-inducible protein OsmY
MNRQARSNLLLAAFAALAILIPTTVYAQQAPQAVDLTSAFRSAGVAVDDLQVYEVGGIVIIRGETESSVAASNAGVIATQLGYTRVANLVRVVPVADDAGIERAAERELSRVRALDGTNIRVDAQDGVLHLIGTVNSDMQKDMAIAAVRRIDGVKSVTAELTR